jgi:hypothetical protein
VPRYTGEYLVGANGENARGEDRLADLPLLIPVPQAAELLGISRASIYTKMKTYSLGPDGSSSAD